MRTLDEVESWLRARITRAGRRAKAQFDRPDHMPGKAPRVRVRLWTATHVYTIVAAPPVADGRPGYLGAQASNRAPRPGEEHSRGNDLTDGGLSDETLNEIMADIVWYEALEIPPVREPRSIPYMPATVEDKRRDAHRTVFTAKQLLRARDEELLQGTEANLRELCLHGPNVALTLSHSGRTTARALYYAITDILPTHVPELAEGGSRAFTEELRRIKEHGMKLRPWASWFADKARHDKTPHAGSAECPDCHRFAVE